MPDQRPARGILDTSVVIVLELFQDAQISAGKAAELLGMSKTRFLDLLDQKSLPYLDAGPLELERDLAVARAAANPTQA